MTTPITRPKTAITRVALITASIGIVGIVSGCSASQSRAPEAAAAAADRYGHVHGLGYDATTGRTYAASHNGVWLVPTDALPPTYGNGSPAAALGADSGPIAGRAQDTMGFFATQDGLLIGSGHPDPAEQPDLQPPSLGFVTSVDGAETWKSVSLRGQTDFHDVDAVRLPDGQLRVYGYDAMTGSVSVSSDSGATWTAGAVIELRDLAADPAVPDRVYATTAAGLQVSNDSGRSFTPVPGAPALYLIAAISSASGSGFVGVDVEGAVWHAPASGQASAQWQKTGTTKGQTEALAFAGGQAPWILASDSRGVIASGDFGATWTTLRGL